jgi:hypothetical protein
VKPEWTDTWQWWTSEVVHEQLATVAGHAYGAAESARGYGK